MNELLEILRGLHPDVDFEVCDSLIDDCVLDSFDIVAIIAEISERFEVTVTADEIVPENFNSARALFSLVERLMD